MTSHYLSDTVFGGEKKPKPTKQCYMFITDLAFVQRALSGLVGCKLDFLPDRNVKLKTPNPLMVTGNGEGPGR